MDNPQTKKCTKCGEVKGLGEFYKDKKRIDDVRWDCKMCGSEYNRKFRAANREEIKEYNHKRYANNPEYSREQSRKWRADNPVRCRELDRRKRARKANAPGSFTAQEWLRSVNHYAPDKRCLWCGEIFEFKDLHRDHVIPITKGGSDSIDNIQPLCQSCNSSKHTKSTDYRPDGGAWARQQLVMELI